MNNVLDLESIRQTERNLTTTSGKYSFIPTTDVLEVLGDSGWLPSSAEQVNARTHGGFQKHLIRLRSESFNSTLQVGDEIPEIVLINSHMGTSSFQLLLGLYRLVCSNGLMVGDTFKSHRIKHIGYTSDAVLEAIDDITRDTPRVLNDIQRFRSVDLTQDEQGVFAMSAASLRFEESQAVNDRQLLQRRRYRDDNGTDLWTTMNVVQENLIKGGVYAKGKNGRRRRTKEVKSIDKDTAINRALWTLTEKMAELKLDA